MLKASIICSVKYPVLPSLWAEQRNVMTEISPNALSVPNRLNEDTSRD